MLALVEDTNEIFTLSVLTALQFKKSFDNTLVNEMPPVRPFTVFPASSLATIKLVTINFDSQVDSFPHASLTDINMVVVPDETTVPAAGDWVIVNRLAEVQVSVAVIFLVKSGTMASQFEFVAIVWLGAHDTITGAVTSLTLIVW